MEGERVEKGKKREEKGLVDAPQKQVINLLASTNIRNTTISSVPRVFITLDAFQRIKCFVDSLGYEINGLGEVEREGNDFIITSAFILKQSTNLEGDCVETDSRALNRFVYELVENGGSASNLKFQWHSHVRMPAFFSPKDIDTIDRYMNDFMISLVVNQQGDCNCRLDLFKPFRLSLIVPLLIRIPYLSEDLIEICKKDIEAMVTVRPSFSRLRFLGLES